MAKSFVIWAGQARDTASGYWNNALERMIFPEMNNTIDCSWQNRCGLGDRHFRMSNIRTESCNTDLDFEPSEPEMLFVLGNCIDLNELKSDLIPNIYVDHRTMEALQ